MADQFDFSPRVNPMQGVSIQDLIGARGNPVNALIQSVSPILEAIHKRQQMQKAAQLLSQQGLAQGTSSVGPNDLQTLMQVLGPSAAQYSQGMAPQREMDWSTNQAKLHDIQAQIVQRLQPRSSSMAQSLTPEEEDALIRATRRTRNPLPTSLLKSRGVASKVIAQSLLADENYNPSDAELELTRARAYESSQGSMLGGGTSQRSAQAANTVKMLLPGLQQTSDAFTRTNFQFANTPIAAFNAQTGGQEAINFRLYVNDIMAKMSSALQSGGMPTDTASAHMREAFPPNITPSQIPGAIKTIQDIMDTQIQGAMTPVTLKDVGKEYQLGAGGLPEIKPRPGETKNKTPESALKYTDLPEGTVIINPKTKVRMKVINGKLSVIK